MYSIPEAMEFVGILCVGMWLTALLFTSEIKINDIQENPEDIFLKYGAPYNPSHKASWTVQAHQTDFFPVTNSPRYKPTPLLNLIS